MTGAVPGYIPAHLQGKVKDFRQESNGDISFQHDAAAKGGFGPDAARVAISQQQYKHTFDPAYRAIDLPESLREQYGMSSPVTTKSEQLRDWLANTIRGGLKWGTSSQAKSVGTVGLLSALGGGALGAWRGSKNGTPITSALLYALLGGATGAGATAFMQNRSNTRAGYNAAMRKQASQALDVIIESLVNDSALSPSQKANVLRGLSRASERELSELSALLRSVTGAGAGVIVMKFLGAKGLIPAIAGGLIGAWLGAPTKKGIQYNSMGQLSLSNYT